jgi:ribosome-associated toxin RatA of RatAB toxin-antitoxin module
VVLKQYGGFLRWVEKERVTERVERALMATLLPSLLLFALSCALAEK